MTIHFDKYHGTGNDFIMIDNRDEVYSMITEEQIKFLCDRHFGIGADGLILLQERNGFDFWMNYFNADGKTSSMCGNGSRCTVAFAFAQGIKRDSYYFVTSDGPHEAMVLADGNIKIKMADVITIEEYGDDKVLDTGSPHFVKSVKNVDHANVKEAGRAIRYNDKYANQGINVNFVEKTAENKIKVRTYERGVEDETLSCGTGVTACSLVSAYQEGENNISIVTPGGSLNVRFNKDENSYQDIWLEGPVAKVFSGTITI